MNPTIYLLNGVPTFNASGSSSVIIGTGLFADGTAGSPSIAFLNQTSLGFYRPSAGTVGLTGNLTVSGAGTSSFAGTLNVTAASLGAFTSTTANSTGGDQTLTIKGANNNTSGAYGANRSPSIAITNTDGSANTYGALVFMDAGGNTSSGIHGVFINDANNEGSLEFWTRPSGASYTNRMTLNSSGNLLVNTTTDNGAKTTISRTGAAPATSGSTSNATLRVVDTSNNIALDFGVDPASPYAPWIQACDRSNLATNYPLSLQRNGGNVLIGGNTDSNNGNLQLKDTSGSSIKGIGFGTDTSLYRVSTSEVGFVGKIGRAHV